MNKWIDFSLKNRLLSVSLAVLVMAAGYLSYTRLPIDAFPDVSPSLVQVFTETEGLAPEEIEKYITFPIETSMNGLPDVELIRSVSNFGLSVVNIYFKDANNREINSIILDLENVYSFNLELEPAEQMNLQNI